MLEFHLMLFLGRYFDLVVFCFLFCASKRKKGKEREREREKRRTLLPTKHQ